MMIRWFLWQNKQANFFTKNIKRWIRWTLWNEKYLCINGVRPVLEECFKVATKLKRELSTSTETESVPLTELSSLVENVHIKTQETSQNTDFVLQNFLGINKALQSMQGELVNNTSKFVEIDKRIKKDSKNLKEVENDSTYSEEQRQLYRDGSNNLKTEQQARLKILS